MACKYKSSSPLFHSLVRKHGPEKGLLEFVKAVGNGVDPMGQHSETVKDPQTVKDYADNFYFEYPGNQSLDELSEKVFKMNKSLYEVGKKAVIVKNPDNSYRIEIRNDILKAAKVSNTIVPVVKTKRIEDERTEAVNRSIERLELTGRKMSVLRKNKNMKDSQKAPILAKLNKQYLEQKNDVEFHQAMLAEIKKYKAVGDLQVMYSKDYPRLERLMRSSEIEDLQEARHIISMYENLSDVYNKDDNQLFTREEIDLMPPAIKQELRSMGTGTVTITDPTTGVITNYPGVVNDEGGASLKEILTESIFDIVRTKLQNETNIDGVAEKFYDDTKKNLYEDVGFLTRMVQGLGDPIETKDPIHTQIIMFKFKEIDSIAKDERNQWINYIRPKLEKAKKPIAKLAKRLGIPYKWDLFRQFVEVTNPVTGEIEKKALGHFVHIYSQKWYQSSERHRIKQEKDWARLNAMRSRINPSQYGRRAKNLFNKNIKWNLTNTISVNPLILPEVASHFDQQYFDDNYPGQGLENVIQFNPVGDKDLTDQVSDKEYERIVEGEIERIAEYLQLRSELDRIITNQGRAAALEFLYVDPNSNINTRDEILQLFDLMAHPENMYKSAQGEWLKFKKASLFSWSKQFANRWQYGINNIPRRTKAKVTYSRGVPTVTDTKTPTEFYDKNYEAIRNDPVIEDFYYAAYDMIATFNKSIPSRYSRGRQINSIANIGKSLLEDLLTGEEAGTWFSLTTLSKPFRRLWKNMIDSVTTLETVEAEVRAGSFDENVSPVSFSRIGPNIKAEAKELEVLLIDDWKMSNERNEAINRKVDELVNQRIAIFHPGGVTSQQRQQFENLVKTQATYTVDQEAREYIKYYALDQVASEYSFNLPFVLDYMMNFVPLHAHRQASLPFLNELRRFHNDLKPAEKKRNIFQKLLGKVRKDSSTIKDPLQNFRINARKMVDWAYTLFKTEPSNLNHPTSFKKVRNRNYKAPFGGDKLDKRIQDAIQEREQWLAQNTGTNIFGYTKQEEKIKEEIAMLESMQRKTVSYLDLSNVVRSWLSYLRFTRIGLSPLTEFFNLFTGMYNNQEEAADGRLVTSANLDKAYRSMTGNVISFWMNIPAHMTNYATSLTFDKELLPTLKIGQKISNIMERNDWLVDTSNDLQRAEREDALRSLHTLPWVLRKATEFINQGVLAKARLLTVKVNDANGNEVSLWDALDKNGDLKPEFNHLENEWNWETGTKMTVEKETIRKLLEKNHGNYTDLGKSYIKREWWGQVGMMFMTWVGNYMRKRIGKEQDDLRAGEKQKGFYLSLTPGTALPLGLATGFILYGPASPIMLGLSAASPYFINMLGRAYTGTDKSKMTGNFFNDMYVSGKETLKRFVSYEARLLSLGTVNLRTVLGNLDEQFNEYITPEYTEYLNLQNKNNRNSQEQSRFETLEQYINENPVWTNTDAANLRALIEGKMFMINALLFGAFAYMMWYDDDKERKKDSWLYQACSNFVTRIMMDSAWHELVFDSASGPAHQIRPTNSLNWFWQVERTAQQFINEIILDKELKANQKDFATRFRETFMPNGLNFVNNTMKTIEENTGVGYPYEREIDTGFWISKWNNDAESTTNRWKNKRGSGRERN